MNLNHTIVRGAMIVSLSLSTAAFAKTISGNYCSEAPIMDFSPAVGVVPSAGWNDFTGPDIPGGFTTANFLPIATGVSGATDLNGDATPDVRFNDGSAATGVALSWGGIPSISQNSNDYINRPLYPATLGADFQDGNDQLMAGYLQVSRFSAADPTLTFAGSGLDSAFGSYSLILYIDGDSDVEPLGVASLDGNNQYSVSIWTDATKTVSLGTTVYGRDGGQYTLTHTTPGNSDFVQVTSTIDGSPTVGNYVQFDGLTSDSFYVEITGVSYLNNGGHGVALNGFQIVPEPATVALFAVGGAMILRKRKHHV